MSAVVQLVVWADSEEELAEALSAHLRALLGVTYNRHLDDSTEVCERLLALLKTAACPNTATSA